MDSGVENSELEIKDLTIEVKTFLSSFPPRIGSDELYSEFTQFLEFFKTLKIQLPYLLDFKIHQMRY